MAAHNETAQVAQVEANAAQAIADAARTSAAVVDAAAADVAAAQRTAQDIAAAAIAAPLATQIAELEQDAETWEREQEQFHASHAARFQTLENQMSEVLSRLTTLETPPLPAIVIAAPADQSLIPPVSEEEIAPTMQETVIIHPETLIPPPASDDTGSAPPKRRTRFL